MVVAGGVLEVAAGVAQQRADGNGLVFEAEAGGIGETSLIDVQSATGAMRRVELSVVEGARVPVRKRKVGVRVGMLTLDTRPAPVPLVIGVAARSGDVVLARRGALRVVFSPRAKAVLTLHGLPRRTRRIELTLNGGSAQLLTSQGCRDEQNFRVTVWRAGVKRAVQAKAGVTC